MRIAYMNGSELSSHGAGMTGTIFKTGLPLLGRRMVLVGITTGALLSSPLITRAFAQTRPIVKPEQFGGGALAGLDNTMAFRRAFEAAAAAGGDVSVGPGEYEVSSLALLREGAIRRPSRVGLIGAGMTATTIRVTGHSVINHLFEARGTSGVVTNGIRFVGNRVHDDSAPGAGGVMFAILTADARGPMEEIRFADCEFDGFASSAPAMVAWFAANPDFDPTNPPEAAFAALASDLTRMQAEKTTGMAGTRINYSVPGTISLFKGGARAAKTLAPPFKEALLAVDAEWGRPAVLMGCGAAIPKPPSRARRTRSSAATSCCVTCGAILTRRTTGWSFRWRRPSRPTAPARRRSTASDCSGCPRRSARGRL